MSVLLLVITTVTLMLPVPTLLVASPVPVTRDTLEMGSYAQVFLFFIILEIKDLSETCRPRAVVQRVHY